MQRKNTGCVSGRAELWKNGTIIRKNRIQKRFALHPGIRIFLYISETDRMADRSLVNDQVEVQLRREDRVMRALR